MHLKRRILVLLCFYSCGWYKSKTCAVVTGVFTCFECAAVAACCLPVLVLGAENGDSCSGFSGDYGPGITWPKLLSVNVEAFILVVLLLIFM